jgi:hypothetical protein
MNDFLGAVVFLVLAYFFRRGFTNTKAGGVVDIRWSGTTGLVTGGFGEFSLARDCVFDWCLPIALSRFRVYFFFHTNR